jgi:hypothetical protein
MDVLFFRDACRSAHVYSMLAFILYTLYRTASCIS